MTKPLEITNKYQLELNFWMEEKKLIRRWYDGILQLHYDTPSPSDTERQFYDSRYGNDSCLYAWLELHQKVKYLKYLDATPQMFVNKFILDLGSGPFPSATCFPDNFIFCLDPLMSFYLDNYFSPVSWGDLQAIPIGLISEDMTLISDHFFDAVIALNALDHVDNIEKTASEIRRVLKPDGTLRMQVHYHPPAPTEPISLSDERMFELFSWKPEFQPVKRTKSILGYKPPEGEEYVLWTT